MRQSHFIHGLLLVTGLSLVACKQSGSDSTVGAVNQPGIEKDDHGWKPYNRSVSGYSLSSDEFCEGELGEVIVIPDPEVPPDIPIELKIRSEKTIAYSTSAAPVDYTGSALNNPVVADNIGFMGNGSYGDVFVKANNISQVGSMSADSINLEATTIGTISSLSSDNINVLAHTLNEAKSFSGTFCASVKHIDSLHSLSSKLTIYGSYSEGTRATIGSIGSMSAFVSFHDVDIGSIQSGSFKGRIENSSIGLLKSGAGEIYLVNSRIEKISNFSGKIHLIGGSSIGTVEQSSIQIIQ